MLQLTAATIGLSLSKSWMIIGNTQWLVRKSCKCENNLTNLERVLEYSLLPDEESVGDQNIKPAFDRRQAKKNVQDIIDRKLIKTAEIASGNIVMDSFSYGYKNNKQVLKSLDLTIDSGTKIGVVGRTELGFRIHINFFRKIIRKIEQNRNPREALERVP